MLTLLTGGVGAGKTSFLVDQVIGSALAAGRRVVCNIELTEHFLQQHKDNITIYDDLFDVLPQVVGKSARYKPKGLQAGDVLIVDEAGVNLSAGVSDEISKSDYKNLRSFLARHRHFVGRAAGKLFACDVWLAAQISTQLTFQIQNLINHTYHLRSIKHLFGLGHGAQVRIYHGSADPDTNDKLIAIRIQRFKPPKDVYKNFQSHDLPLNADSSQVIENQNAPPLLRSAVLSVGLLLVFVVSLGIAGVNSISTFGRPTHEKSNHQIIQNNASAVSYGGGIIYRSNALNLCRYFYYGFDCGRIHGFPRPNKKLRSSAYNYFQHWTRHGRGFRSFPIRSAVGPFKPSF